MPESLVPKGGPGCPVGLSLDVVGDRWSLLVIRDLMVRGHRTFKEFQDAGEGIATNILADRLKKLEKAGVIETEAEPADARRVYYRLTEKGIDLAPVMLELLLWGTRYENTAFPAEIMNRVKQDRQGFLNEVRRRWRERDTTPLIPNLQPNKRKGETH
jgi:DNA-binding HxlR family transcriptional regulator